jgi:hypothetical protein
VVIDRRLGAAPLPPPGLLFPEAVCPEAFDDHGDNLCAPRQIAAILKRDMDEICDELREAELRLSGSDTVDQGVTSRVILEFCRQHGFGAAVVWNEKVIETMAGKPVPAWTLHESASSPGTPATAAGRRCEAKKNAAAEFDPAGE